MGGELSSMKKASLPIAAAVGGMVFPAILYVIVTINYPEYINGWGIPMATDIAFALGAPVFLASLDSNAQSRAAVVVGSEVLAPMLTTRPNQQEKN